jgi:hypothetical protein
VLEERALDLERPDAVAGGDDDVVGASDEPQIAVLVAPGAVAGDVPFAAPRGRGLLRVLPVLAEERRGRVAERQVADLARLDLRARLVDDADVVAGKRLPHRSRADRHPGRFAASTVVSVWP